MKDLSKMLLSIFVLLIANHKAVSQPNTEWVQRFNSAGNYNDYVTDMAIDKSGNVYLTGYIQINDSNQNYVTIKYNSQGNQQWVRYYDGPDHRSDRAGFIAVDDSGNVFVSGSSYSLVYSDDYLTIKYNSNGDSLWVRRNTYGLTASAMALDNQDNVYVTGGTINGDILTVKYNNDGDQIWSRAYDGNTHEYDDVHGICCDALNNVYLAGRSFINNVQYGVILKYNSNGDFKWATGVNFVFIFFRAGIDDSNFLYVCGHFQNINNTDISVSKFDTLGNLQWNRTYNRSNSTPNQNDYFRSFTLDKFGNTYITGVNSDNVLRWDIATVKFNKFGDTLWTRIFGTGSSNDEPTSICVDKFQNTYVTGGTDGGGLFSKYVTLKYDINGSMNWFTFYNNNNSFASHSASKILCDTLGNLYVTGSSQENGSLDIATIKYSKLTNAINNSGIISKEYILNQNFPNPFNPQTRISFTIPVRSFISLKVFNLLGEEVAILVNDNLNEGNYDQVFDGSNLPSGIYYYSLSVNGLVIGTKKSILLK